MKRRTLEVEDDKEEEEEEERKKKKRYGIAGLSPQLLALICLTAVNATTDRPISKQPKRNVDKGKVIVRTRQTVSSVMDELGKELTRRYFRMNRESFFSLHAKLSNALSRKDCDDTEMEQEGQATNKRTPPNGAISTEVRLAAALRYFAGGSALDIALVFGINHWDIFCSVWRVVDAINKTAEFDISYPSDHTQQKLIALGFKRNSQIGIDCCAGAIDGMLVWINRPTKKECQQMKIGLKKFYCGRKKKFALNLQGVCDTKRRFIDISIRHPGSTSDYLAFRTSNLHHKLEEEDFISVGLALFGDNAYVSNAYMVTPFKGVSSGAKDAFNYYQSQGRISIECAFGMLVQRWGILRKPFPVNITISKTCALVVALCKLHNYCINSKAKQANLVSSPSGQDEFNIALGGGIPLERTDENPYRPTQLLDGNEQPTDDFDRAAMAREQQATRILAVPRDKILDVVEGNNYQRVVPASWML